MTRAKLLAGGGLLGVAAALGWLLFAGLPRWYAPKPPAAPQATAAPQAPERKIKATLFYVAEDGLRLVGVEREVPYGEGTIDQAQRIVEEQLKPAPAPLVGAVPPGTTLRALYVTDRGEAFVDVSGQISSAHTGGSIDEIFTVYTIVNALTTNLPAIASVQILVDGKEVDTLAGHVDLRRPLQKNLRWVQEPATGAAAAPPGPVPSP